MHYILCWYYYCIWDWLADIVLSYFILLSIFSWCHLTPRPSATSSIQFLTLRATCGSDVWFDFVPEAKQAKIYGAPGSFHHFQKHTLHRVWWLPQSCWRDQVIELSKCMWINSLKSICDQQETEDEREQVDKCHLASSLRWAVRDTRFCRAIWVSNTTHGQAGA